MGGVRPEGWRPTEETYLPDLNISESFDFPQVERRLRNVPLNEGAIPGFHPYRSSIITLEQVIIDQLRPCSLYLLASQLEFLKKLDQAFLNKGINILNLSQENTALDYRSGGGKNFTIMPPVVEVSDDDQGTLVITDGLHRTHIAKMRGLKTIMALKIQKTAIPLPVLPIEWPEIKLCDTVPPSEQKRRFRFTDMQEIWQWIDDHQERFKQGFEPRYYCYRSL